MLLNLLTAKIKGLAAESQKINKTFQKIKQSNIELEKRIRELYWISQKKLYTKDYIRSHYLAYAFIKNTPYSKLERKCNAKPNIDKILEIVLEMGYILREDIKTGKLRKYHYYKDQGPKVKSKITSWMKGEPHVLD
jgi:predicted transcriptional regulator